MNMSLRITYENGASFIPVCEHCRRFVKADDVIHFNGFDELKDVSNATCSKHGRVQMEFEGWFDIYT